MNVYDAQKSDQLLKNISSARFDFLIIFCSISPPHHHFSTTDIQTVGAAMFLAASFFFFFSYSANILNLFFSWYIFALDCGCQLAGEAVAVHPSDLKVSCH